MYKGVAYYKKNPRPLSHGKSCSKKEENLSKFRKKAWPSFKQQRKLIRPSTSMIKRKADQLIRASIKQM